MRKIRLNNREFSFAEQEIDKEIKLKTPTVLMFAKAIPSTPSPFQRDDYEIIKVDKSLHPQAHLDYVKLHPDITTVFIQVQPSGTMEGNYNILKELEGVLLSQVEI